MMFKEVTFQNFHLVREIGIATYLEFDPSIWSSQGKAQYLETQFNLDKLKSDFENSEIHYFLLYDNEILIGLIKLKDNQPLPISENVIGTELEKIYILKKFSGKGLGKVALDFVVNYTRKINSNLVWLDVLKTNQIAIDFYQKYGFKIVSELDFETDVAKPDMWVMCYTYKNNYETRQKCRNSKNTI